MIPITIIHISIPLHKHKSAYPLRDNVEGERTDKIAGDISATDRLAFHYTSASVVAITV